jgi:hypothetical protein
LNLAAADHVVVRAGGDVEVQGLVGNFVERVPGVAGAAAEDIRSEHAGDSAPNPSDELPQTAR